MKLSTCTEWLFFHLWKKNPQTGLSCQGVFVADTVIYRWAQPYFRYFTAHNGQIIRKTKERVFVENVEQSFEGKNIVALLLTSEQQNKSQESIYFEYFEKDNFAKFLYQREKELNSILQKFIYPKGSQNSLIKVSWSPQFCLLHRKTNVNNIDDLKKTLYEKVCTFEGPEYLSESDSISSPLLSSDLEQLCVNIVKHVQEVSGGNIQIIRMVLYFKVDEDNRIWLLFCTGVKVRDKFTQRGEEQPRVQSPLFRIIRRDLEPVEMGSESVQKVIRMNGEGYVQNLQYQFPNICSNCDLFSQDLYQITFSNIIESFEKKLVENLFTRLPEELEKKRKNQQNDTLRLNSNIRRRQKQFVNHNYEVKNFFEIQSANQSEQQIIVEKQQLVDHKKTFDSVQGDIQELCRQLDEEQEDQKINFKTVPALILKVWGSISEEKYKQFKLNPSWCGLKTQTCLECFLKFTECLEQTKFERNIKTVQIQLRQKVDEQLSEKIIQGQFTAGGGSKKHVNLPPVGELQQQKMPCQKLISPTQKPMQKSTAINTPSPAHVPMPKFFNKFIDQKVQFVPNKNAKKIYSHKQGLHISLNNSQQSKSSKSTLDQSKISVDFMLNTVQLLKKKLQEIDYNPEHNPEHNPEQKIIES
ncbi:hypothetical protein pb186bvf_003330 [Paramecium bursaria]